jgi:hypothetical protein
MSDDAEVWEDDGDEDVVRGGDVLGPNGPRVLDERCSTCIFRPGNLMHLRPGRVRQMVRDSLDGGGFITCHATLDDRRQYAVCRGFYDAHGPASNLLRVWSRLGGFDFVRPPEGHREGDPLPGQR